MSGLIVFLTEDLGDFGVQILNVQDSQHRIEIAYNTLKNIPRRAAIEQNRADRVIQIIYDANNRINLTELPLAMASSFSVSSSLTAGLPPSFTAGVSFNPLAGAVGVLNIIRNNIQANQQARIEGVNSDATVRNLLLDMDNAAIELDRAKILFDQDCISCHPQGGQSF